MVDIMNSKSDDLSFRVGHLFEIIFIIIYHNPEKAFQYFSQSQIFYLSLLKNLDFISIYYSILKFCTFSPYESHDYLFGFLIALYPNIQNYIPKKILTPGILSCSVFNEPIAKTFLNLQFNKTLGAIQNDQQINSNNSKEFKEESKSEISTDFSDTEDLNNYNFQILKSKSLTVIHRIRIYKIFDKYLTAFHLSQNNNYNQDELDISKHLLYVCLMDHR